VVDKYGNPCYEIVDKDGNRADVKAELIFPPGLDTGVIRHSAAEVI
jgi:hypothetical protein